jgi:hypothetical protein
MLLIVIYSTFSETNSFQSIHTEYISKKICRIPEIAIVIDPDHVVFFSFLCTL